MKSVILFPTKKKIISSLLVVIVLWSTLLLRLIPPSVDIFDLREIPGFVMVPFGRIPISIFDWITANRYAPKGEGFLVFPSSQEILFAIVFDVIIIYLATCFVIYWKEKRSL